MRTVMQDTANLTTILQAALVTKLASHRTAERTAAGMWLMTIVHRLGAHPLVQRNLGDFQAAFTLLLGERRQFAPGVQAHVLVGICPGACCIGWCLAQECVALATSHRSANCFRVAFEGLQPTHSAAAQHCTAQHCRATLKRGDPRPCAD